MVYRLEEIATINTGIYEKGGPSGDTYYLQAKHFDEFGKFREDVLIKPEIAMEMRLENHQLNDGDILLTAKGENNRACLFQERIGQSVASSTFLVIRIKNQVFIPAYLHWLLNTPYMQAILSGLSKGTQISSLSKKALADFEVWIPPMFEQKKIIEFTALLERERTLMKELLQHKDSFYQNLLLNLAKST